MARATLDTKTGEYSFQRKLASEVPVNKANVKALEEIFAANGLSETSPLGVGVDQGLSWQRLIKILCTELSSTLKLFSTFRIIPLSFLATSLMLKSPTTNLSHHHYHHSPHAGRARRPCSSC
jgi:hypothetical protein